MLFREMFGCISGLSVNAICIDLFWCTLTRYFLYHSDKCLICICKFDEAAKGFSFMDKMILSSV